MVEEKEYELLPHDELQKLRDEVERIKRNPLHGQKVSDDLKASVDKLTTTMTNFINLLANTNDELVHQFEKTSIQSHFSKISDQNEQIAQAILTLAEMVQKPEPAPPQPTPSQSGGFPVASDNIAPTHDPSFEPHSLPGQNTNPTTFPQPQPGVMNSSPLPTDSLSNSNIPPLPNPNSNIPSQQPLFPDPNLNHPLNSGGPDLPDLPPPPPKKKGLLGGVFK